MKPFRNILLGMAISLILSGVTSGIERFPPPDFVETDHVIPSPTSPGPRQDVYEYIDAAVLLAALGLASYLVLKKRSRRAIFALFRILFCPFLTATTRCRLWFWYFSCYRLFLLFFSEGHSVRRCALLARYRTWFYRGRSPYRAGSRAD